MESIFLDEAEVTKLTGHQQKGAQKRFLRRKGICFDVNAIGEIVVLRKHIENRLSGAIVGERDEDTPNFGFLSYGKA